jgi:hypothetical protein
MALVCDSYGVRLALALLMCASQSVAEPGPPARRNARERAVVTLIAAAADSPELLRVLNEFLARDEIDVQFAKQSGFGSAELLRVSGDGAVEAFVLPDGAAHARLYFRAPDGQRFLVRDVALPSGLDALGRELIAQIVESSIVALLHSEVGISRAQLKAEVESSAAEEPSAAAQSTPKPKPASANTSTPLPARVPPRLDHAAHVIEGWLAARYAADWSGSALGLRQGPAFELGIGLGRTNFVRARFVLERDFPATLHAGPIDANVATTRWRSAVDWGTAVGRNEALAFSLGAGEDRSQIEPIATSDAFVVPAAASRATPFVLHSEARLEASFAPFRLAFAFGFDVPLEHTPYDVDRGASAKELAAPWAVRPGVALSAAWCPALGSF